MNGKTEATATLASGRQRAAIAVWRIEGPPEATRESLLATGVELPATGRVGLRRFGMGTSSEGIVCCRISESVAELTTHGGSAVQRRSEALFRDAGLAIADPEPIDTVLADAATLKVLNRMRTAIRQTLEWSDGPLTPLQSETAMRYAERLRTVPVLALVGRPNVGKSSLLNRLLGYERAVVFDREGVTRDRIMARSAFDGWPVDLIDTAGFETVPSLSELDRWLAPHITDAAASLIAFVVDGRRPLAVDERDFLRAAETAGKRLLFVASHADCPEFALPGDRFAAVSSVDGTGILALGEEIGRRIVIEPPPPGPIPL